MVSKEGGKMRALLRPISTPLMSRVGECLKLSGSKR
jgi:hypothetical protein